MERNLEYGIPTWLKKSILVFESHADSIDWDIFYCELQSDINVCETEQQITKEQADFLRKKYL